MDAVQLVRVLAAADRTLAVAESFTGGRLLDLLTSVPGASRVLRGGVVAYTNDVKRDLLGVPEGVLMAEGAVSAATARAMAEGARHRFAADVAVATTGIAGPSGATVAKPLGLSFAAAAGPARTIDASAVHPGDRDEVKTAGVRQALDVLARLLVAEGIL